MRAPRVRLRVITAGAGVAIVGSLLAAVSGGSAAIAAGSAPAATSPPHWAAASEIDAFLRTERAEMQLSGLAVVVLARGSVVFDRAYGDAAPGGPAVTRDTPFLLGSTSKQFTGLAIQQLIAQGRLSSDDTVGVLLRSSGGETSPLAGVTVRQLLSHTSGISTAAGTADVFDPTPSFTSLADETRHLLRTAPDARPGAAFEYSNANYTLLGAILESVTGRSFEAALQSLVAGPLGLDRTTSDLTLARSNGLAVGHYTWLRAIDSTTPGPQWPMGAPSAYTTSTASDLTRLLRAELGQSSGIDRAVFTADHAPLSTVDTVNRYASGWYVRPFWELHDHDENYTDPTLPKIYEHAGDAARDTSYLAFVPELGLGVAVLSNTGLGTDSGRAGALTYRLLHTIVGTTATPDAADPLVAAAPVIMVALPLAQLAAVILLIVSFARTRRSRFVRRMSRVVAALVTVVTLLVAFLVVPAQTKVPLLDRSWLAGVPDLATSVAISLLLATACLVVAAVGLLRAAGNRRRGAPAL